MSSYAWGTWEGTAEGFLAEKWKQPRQTVLVPSAAAVEKLCGTEEEPSGRRRKLA